MGSMMRIISDQWSSASEEGSPGSRFSRCFEGVERGAGRGLPQWVMGEKSTIYNHF